jgi:hypothetical protein
MVNSTNLSAMLHQQAADKKAGLDIEMCYFALLIGAANMLRTLHTDC